MKSIYSIVPPPPPINIIIWILKYLIINNMMSVVFMRGYTNNPFHTIIAMLLTVHRKIIPYRRKKKCYS